MKFIKNSYLALLLSVILVFSAGCSTKNTSSKSSSYLEQGGTTIVSQQEKTSPKEDNNEISDTTSSETAVTQSQSDTSVGSGQATPVTQTGIPTYSGKEYETVNNNVPNFSSAEITSTGYEKYSDLDSLGRVGVAIASLGKETMPKSDEKRGSISSIYPTGWIQAKYDNISGKYLYNRCHLIGWQLSAENDNKKNLMTGTKSFNVSGMLPFENMVADYIKETNNHVAYRVTPVFEGNNLLASGVQMEAFSVEDSGKGICFNVYCFNVQSGISIDYATGASSQSGTAPSTTSSQTTPSETTPSSDTSTVTPQPKVTVPSSEETTGNLVWVPTNGGKKYHSRSNCSNMKDPMQVSKETAEANGYTPCSRCN